VNIDSLKKTFHNKRILITGGMGLLGSNLARLLLPTGAIITVIDNFSPKHGANKFNLHDIQNEITTVIADIGDAGIINKLVCEVDYIFNFAGQSSHIYSMVNPLSDLDGNLRAQLTLLEACRKFNPKVKIFFSSTRQVYGIPEQLPVDENHKLAPIDINGHHKLLAEEYHNLYYKHYGIRSVIFRLTNTYGPGMRVKDGLQNFLGLWIRQTLENEAIQVFGDGKQIRDFNHVEDVLDAILTSASMATAYGQTYNLGNDTFYTLTEIAELMITITGTGRIEYIPFPKHRKAIDIGNYYANTRKIKQKIQWEPHLKFPEGLEKVLSFYKKNQNQYFS